MGEEEGRETGEREAERDSKTERGERSFYLRCSTWFQGQLILKQQNIKLVRVCVCVCVY